MQHMSAGVSGGRKGLPRSFLNRFTRVVLSQLQQPQQRMVVQASFTGDLFGLNSSWPRPRSPEDLRHICKRPSSLCQRVWQSTWDLDTGEHAHGSALGKEVVDQTVPGPGGIPGIDPKHGGFDLHRSDWSRSFNWHRRVQVKKAKGAAWAAARNTSC